MHRHTRPAVLLASIAASAHALAGPLPPVFPAIGDQRVPAGRTLSFRVAPTDPDGPVPGVFLAAGPPGAALIDNGDGSRTFRWSAPETASGRQPVRLVAVDAEDGLRRTTLDLVIAVGARPGTDDALGLEARTSYAVRAGTALDVRLVPTDSAGRVPSLSAIGLPRGATLPDNRDGTRSLRWTPGADDAGRYPVTLVVRAANDPARELRVATTITVLPADGADGADGLDGAGPGAPGDPAAPRLVLPSSVTVTAGETVGFTVAATLPDGRVAALVATSAPAGATFTDRGDGTRRFSWSTDGVAPGTVTIRFRATSPGGGATGEAGVAVRVLAPDDGAPSADAELAVDGPLADLAFAGARLTPDFAPDVDRYRLDAGFLQPTLVPIADGEALAPVSVPVGASALRVRSNAGGRTVTVDVRRADAGTFVERAELQASGFDVALVGDTLIAGDETGARVFDRVDGRWRQVDTLGACRDRAIAFDGTRVVLANRSELVDGIGCDADAGAPIAVYRLDAGGWTREQAFGGREGDGPDAFFAEAPTGTSAAIDGARIAIGNAVARATEPGGGRLVASGAVTLYRLEAGAWELERVLTASNAGFRDGFGERVALEGDLLAVAAPQEGSAASGVDGDRFDDTYTPAENRVFGSGAVYLFEREGGEWTETAYLKASDNVTAFYRFGRGLDVDAGRVAVGAPFAAEDPDALRFDANGGLLNRARGRAYLFEHDGDTWREAARLDPAPGTDDFAFGSDVALDGGALAVLSALRTSLFETDAPAGIRLGAVEATGTALDLDAGTLAIERYQQDGVAVFAGPAR